MKTLLLFILIATVPANGSTRNIIQLWPDAVPGESEPKALPVISDNNPNNVIRVTNVTNPTLTVYEANPEKANGAAVIICPGGGYNLLAIDLEGYEIADWLSSLGYTAFFYIIECPKIRKALCRMHCVQFVM